MAPRQTKIEKLGLADRVEELMTQGITTAARIAELLRTENPGISVSDSAVQRFVARIKDDIKPEARTIIRDHVAENLPKDLDILEEMQGICLEWMREAGKDQVERVAEASAVLANEIPHWKQRLIESDDGEARKVAAELIQRAIFLIAIDDRKQERRLMAMKQLNQTIDVKFRHGGLLDSDGDDGIRIFALDEDSMKKKVADPDGYQPFSVIDGKQGAKDGA